MDSRHGEVSMVRECERKEFQFKDMNTVVTWHSGNGDTSALAAVYVEYSYCLPSLQGKECRSCIA
jgi:hypothetical protein